jgi:hypothetical protein
MSSACCRLAPARREPAIMVSASGSCSTSLRMRRLRITTQAVRGKTAPTRAATTAKNSVPVASHTSSGSSRNSATLARNSARGSTKRNMSSSDTRAFSVNISRQRS